MEHSFGHFGRRADTIGEPVDFSSATPCCLYCGNTLNALRAFVERGGEFAHRPQMRQGHWGRCWTADPERVTVNGTLQLIGGHIAVIQDNKTYYTMNLYHLAGFIDGFKEGAAVTLEGSACPLPGDKDLFRLMTTKLTLNGKEYNLGDWKKERDFMHFHRDFSHLHEFFDKDARYGNALREKWMKMSEEERKAFVEKE
jgi:hypothetical protein